MGDLTRALTKAQQLMVEDGCPPNIFLNDEQRREAWARNPPKAVVFRDPMREVQDAQRKRETDKRLALLIMAKAGLPWCNKTLRWVSQEDSLNQLTITAFDPEGVALPEGTAVLPEETDRKELEKKVATMARALKAATITVVNTAGETVLSCAYPQKPLDEPREETDSPANTKETKVATKAKAKTKGAAKAKVAKGNGKAAAKAAKAPKAAKKAARAKGEVKPGGKVEIIANLLKRKSGCTEAECAAATGWAKVSMGQQAAKAGLKLRKEKVSGKATRYFGE